MSEKITIKTSNSAGRKAAGLGALVISGALALGIGYGGYRTVAGLHNAYVRSNNKAEIENALKANDYVLAEKLLKAYTDEGKLDTGARVALGVQIEDGKQTQSLDAKIAKGDLAAAKDAFEKLKPRLSGEATAVYQAQIYGQKEQEMFDTIVAKPIGWEKSDFCYKFLNNFPESTNRKRVMQELVINDLSRFDMMLSDGTNFAENYKFILLLTQNLNKFPNEGITIPADFQDKINKKINDFLNDYCIKPDGVLEIGEKVKVMPLKNDALGYEATYVAERNNTIPVGSIGDVIRVHGSDIYVKFPTLACKWTTNWGEGSTDGGLFAYWKDDKKNVAYFKDKEILVRRTLMDFDKDKFMKEVWSFNSALNAYIPQIVGPVK